MEDDDSSLMRRLSRPLRAPVARPLGGVVDALLQTFENCRAALADADAAAGGAAVERFFGGVYEREQARLADAIALHGGHLPPPARDQLHQALDQRLRSVVIPAYARLAGPLTVRERNDFYAAPRALHGLERLGWAAAGMLLGAFVVWAPFIPLWSKELVLVFGLGGLLFPELRRLLALRRYQSELNRLAARTEADVERLEMALLTQGITLEAAAAALDDAAGRLPALTEGGR